MAKARRIGPFVLTAAIAALPVGAHAGGFGNRLQSAVGTGDAFAGAGTSDFGLSGMFWNPAAVNDVDDFETSSNYTLAVPQARIRAQPGTSAPLLGLGADSGDVGQGALVPGSYLAYRINPQWAVGLSVNSPFGLATKPANLPWAGQNLSITAKALSVDVAAVIGYKVNDWLSVAAGPRWLYADARFTRDVIPGDAAIEPGILSGLKDSGWGYTLGATIKPWEGGEIALGYRSRVDLSLKGDLSLPDIPAIFGPLAGTHPVVGDITLPDQATVSFSQKLSPEWTLLGSVEWKDWSLVQDVPFYIRNSGPLNGLNPTTLTFRYKDGWNLALGAEYHWNDQLTLRGGASYEISPIKDDQREVSIPDGDRIWVSAGASYAFNDHFTFDVGYSHAFVKDGSIKVGPGTPNGDSGELAGLTFLGETTGSVDVVSVGIRYKFGGAAVAALPQQPVVAKY